MKLLKRFRSQLFLALLSTLPLAGFSQYSDYWTQNPISWVNNTQPYNYVANTNNWGSGAYSNQQTQSYAQNYRPNYTSQGSNIAYQANPYSQGYSGNNSFQGSSVGYNQNQTNQAQDYTITSNYNPPVNQENSFSQNQSAMQGHGFQGGYSPQINQGYSMPYQGNMQNYGFQGNYPQASYPQANYQNYNPDVYDFPPPPYYSPVSTYYSPLETNDCSSGQDDLYAGDYDQYSRRQQYIATAALLATGVAAGAIGGVIGSEANGGGSRGSRGPEGPAGPAGPTGATGPSSFTSGTDALQFNFNLDLAVGLFGSGPVPFVVTPDGNLVTAAPFSPIGLGQTRQITIPNATFGTYHMGLQTAPSLAIVNLTLANTVFAFRDGSTTALPLQLSLVALAPLTQTTTEYNYGPSVVPP